MTRNLLALLLSASMLATPSYANENMFRSQLTAPIYFSGESDGNTGGDEQGGGNDEEPEASLPFMMSLAGRTFEGITIGTNLHHDFREQLVIENGDPDLTTLSLGSPANIPAATSFSGGVISGPLTTAGTYNLRVVANHPEAEASVNQLYTILVAGIPLEVIKIDSSGTTTCAVTTTGAAYCWGRNHNGQLGDGTTTDRWNPVQVTGLASGVTDISVSGSNACAVHNGAAKCWGWNARGVIGDGTQIDRHVPTQVSGLGSGVTAVHSGSDVSCAIHNGRARCWGRNNNGQVGDGTDVHPRLTPRNVSGLSSNVSEITSGSEFVCAIHNGAAKCWGKGPLGRGVYETSNVPVQVTGLDSEVTKISSSFGANHVCSVHNGAAKCWGSSTDGRLGDGQTSGTSYSASQVSGLTSGVTHLDAGRSGACAVHNGVLKCWGNNANGQLGAGSELPWATPQNVSGISGTVSNIAPGDSHTCAIVNGSAQCWGQNNSGQLGDGTRTNRANPMDVILRSLEW